VGLTSVLLLVTLGVAFGPYRPTVSVLSFLEILPLAIRRVRPTLSFALVAAPMAVQLFLTDLPIWGQVAMPVAVYSVAAHAPRAHARFAFGVALLGGVLGPADWLFRLADGNSTSSLVGVFVLTELLVIAPWALGSLTLTRRAYVAELVDRGHRLEREAAQRAELAASDERARIAREMHDIVAHGLSVMIVQADGAGYAVQRDPGAASRALGTIAATGRESLTEMRRMLGLLRHDDGSGSRPQPGIADLAFLVDQSRAAGMDVTVDATGLPELGAGVALTVYRVVQEGLTNVRKHAGPQAHVRVAVVAHDDELCVEVSDDGRGPLDEDESGHGLIGMRERVAVHGGRLHAGPRPGGGFLLRAELPMRTDEGR
jgi:signal transduction histidine kinase